MPTSRHPLAAIALVAVSCACQAAGPGLSLEAEDTIGSHWGARLTVQTEAAAPIDVWNPAATPRTTAIHLLGDYYVGRAGAIRPGSTGGLRLTSGLWMAEDRHDAVGLPLAAARLNSWPYLGVGYSATSVRGGWGLHADLGLAMQNPSGLRLGQVVSGAMRLDDAVRELRLRPVLAIGASYTF